MMDPPEHDRLRALVSRVFTPRAVTALEPMIREVISSFLDPLERRDRVRRRRRLLRDRSRSRSSRACSACPRPTASRSGTGSTSACTASRAARAAPTRTWQAILETGAYFYDLAVEKRTNPGDDMMSRLTQVTVDRGDGTETGLDDVEIAGFADAARRRRRGDGHQARRQRGGALRAAPRPVAEGPRRPRQDPARGRGDPAHTCRRRSTRAGTRVDDREFEGGTHPGRLPGAAHHRRGDPRPARVRGPRRLRHRTAAEHLDRFRPRRAQLSRRRAGADGEPHRDRGARRGAGSASRSTRPVCAGSTCRTSPATRTCRCALSAEEEHRATASAAHAGDRVVLDVGRRRPPADPALHRLRHARAPTGPDLPGVPQPGVGADRGVGPRRRWSASRSTATNGSPASNRRT